MNKLKLGIYVALLLGLMMLTWYFFIKKYDYKITFTSPQSPGAIYSNLIAWNNWQPKSKKVVDVINKHPFKSIEQELKINDSIIGIKWIMEKQSDSVTKVIAQLSDTEHSVAQRIAIPFTQTDFVKRSLSTVKQIREGINAHENDYKVSPVTKATIPESNVAYIELSCKTYHKAKEMMKHTIDVMQYIRSNGLELIGDPFVQIINWDILEEDITFHFCFPIKKLGAYPKSNRVKVKTIEAQKAIKTIFNGNYRISDRGWFHLIDYAETKGLDIAFLPLEVFKDDPHSGGNELEWVAEVYLPLKENN